MEDQEYTENDVINSSAQHGDQQSHQPEETAPSTSFQEELRNKERENQLLREQLMMLKEYHQRQQPASSQQQAFRGLEDIEDDGYVPAAHFKQNVAMLKALKEEHELLKKGMIEYIGRLEQEKVQKKYPHLVEQQAQLEKILNQDPDLRAAYEANPNPHLAAAILRGHNPNNQESAQRIVSNAKKTGSLASVGGAPIDHVSRIDKMSREEFLKYAFENKNI